MPRRRPRGGSTRHPPPCPDRTPVPPPFRPQIPSAHRRTEGRSMTATIPPPPTDSSLLRDPRRLVIWIAVAGAGALAWCVRALTLGERVNAIWLLVAALASYAIAYRFY